MKKATLGRGLESLFEENGAPADQTVSMLRITEIEPNPNQPRKNFSEDALKTLADSISRHGMLQPIAVREEDIGLYQIIAGERRWRAAKMAGLTEIPAIIYEMDDRKAAELALIENLQREDLNPVEEALAFRTLLEQFGMTQEEAAEQVGKSRSAVANSLRLLDLPKKILDYIAEGVLSAGHARAILSLRDKSDYDEMTENIIDRGLSVRQAETMARQMNLRREEPDDTPQEKPSDVTKSYYRSLEKAATRKLGQRFRIVDEGKDKAKHIEIFYQENEELETLLKRLCGDDFFSEGTV